MIGTLSLVLRQEFRLLTRDRGFLAALAILALLLIGATKTGLQEAHQRQRAWELTQRSDINKRLDFKGSDPGAASFELSHYVTVPSKPLGILCLGQADLFPSQFQISTLWSSLRDAKETIENPSALAAGKLDVSFLVVYLIPLLLIITLHDVVSSERERGTLSLILTQPIRLSGLLSFRIGLRLTFVVGLTAGFPLILSKGELLKHADFGIWMAFAAVWCVAWCLLILFVNTFRLSSASNALSLFAVWLLALVISPSLLKLVVTSLYPVPSRVGVAVAHRDSEERAQRNRTRNFNLYLASNPQLKKPTTNSRPAADFSWGEWIVMMQTADRSTQAVNDRFHQQLERQQTLIETVEYLLPAVLMQTAMDELGGSSSTRLVNFERQAARFNQEWSRFFERLIFTESKYSREDLARLPKFTYDISHDRRARAKNLTRLFWLFCATALLGIASLKRIEATQN